MMSSLIYFVVVVQCEWALTFLLTSIAELVHKSSNFETQLEKTEPTLDLITDLILELTYFHCVYWEKVILIFFNLQLVKLVY